MVCGRLVVQRYGNLYRNGLAWKWVRPWMGGCKCGREQQARGYIICAVGNGKQEATRFASNNKSITC